MAARKQLFHPDEVKKKIQTSQLINRLQKHALSDDGPIMTDSQVRAAFGLIAKTLPDQKAVDGAGDSSEKIVLEVVIGGNADKN